MPKETTGWFKRRFTIVSDFTTVCTEVTKICSAEGFKIREESAAETGKSYKAMYGSRLLAVLFDLIPYLGKHLPWGKRLFLEATTSREENGVHVDIGVTPYMELLNCEEFFPISQSIDERATDEYFASLKLHRITHSVFRSVGEEVPAEFEELQIKPGTPNQTLCCRCLLALPFVPPRKL